MCQFYRSGAELVDLCVPYFQAGLASNERCLWITAEPLAVADAWAALREAVPDVDERAARGQITVVAAAEWYFSRGALALDSALDRCLSLEQQALASGYAGLRVSGNTSSLAPDDWSSLAAHEARSHHALHDRKILGLCAYSLDRCGPEQIMDVLRNHKLALVRRDGSWSAIQSATLMLATMAGARQEAGAQDAGSQGIGIQAQPCGHIASAAGGAGELPVTQLTEFLATSQFAPGGASRRPREADMYPLESSAPACEPGSCAGEELAAEHLALAAEHLARLQRVTSALSEAATNADIARVVVTELSAVLEADQAMLAVSIDGGKALLLLGQSDAQPQAIEAFGRLPVEESLPVATAFRTGRPIWLSSLEAIRAEYPYMDIGHARAIASVPLMLGGQRLGGICLGFSAARDFSAAERALLDDLARQVALAIERARLYEEARRANDRMKLLADTAACISRARLDLVRVLDSIIAEVTRQFADVCVIHLQRGDSATLDVGAVRHINPEIEAEIRQVLAEATVRLGVGLIGTVAATGRSVLVPAVTGDTIADAIGKDEGHLARYRVRSLVVVPLCSGREVLGTLTVARCDPADAFTPDDQCLMQDLGDRVALSIENARLYERANAERTRAQNASRAKDEFMAMLGHELRNPLSPIVTALQLMRLHESGVLLRERTIIERQVNHMIRLVDDLLDVSRITGGKIKLVRVPIEMAEVVGKAIEMASPILEERGHELHTSVPATGVVVDVDAHRFAQVIANLLMNAAKYTPRGGSIELCVRARESVISVSVRDNGVGIDPVLLPDLFELFVQGRQTLDRSKGGLGLGLAIVRTLVEMHGGVVRVHSDGPGQGSEFTIELPWIAARSARQRSAVATSGSPDAAPRPSAPVTPRRVLIVDDNRDAASGLDDVLSAVGHVTRVAHDGPAALRIAATFRPEVALLDIGLPVMDGYELGCRLCELLPEAKPRLVAVTGYGQKSDLARSKEAGFDEHLVKPIDLDGLQFIIERLFQAPDEAAELTGER